MHLLAMLCWARPRHAANNLVSIQKEQEHGFSNPWLREERTDRNVRSPVLLEQA